MVLPISSWFDFMVCSCSDFWFRFLVQISGSDFRRESGSTPVIETQVVLKS
jgi:hypothetical protein